MRPQAIFGPPHPDVYLTAGLVDYFQCKGSVGSFLTLEGQDCACKWAPLPPTPGPSPTPSPLPPPLASSASPDADLMAIATVLSLVLAAFGMSITVNRAYDKGPRPTFWGYSNRSRRQTDSSESDRSKSSSEEEGTKRYVHGRPLLLPRLPSGGTLGSGSSTHEGSQTGPRSAAPSS